MKIKLKVERTLEIDKEAVIKDLKMLNGLPPYDGAGNICNGDGYFANSIEKKYGADIETLAKAVGFDAIAKKWQSLRKQMC